MKVKTTSNPHWRRWSPEQDRQDAMKHRAFVDHRDGVLSEEETERRRKAETTRRRQAELAATGMMFQDDADGVDWEAIDRATLSE